MKRIFVLLLIMVVVGTAPAFANDETHFYDKSKETLKTEFAGAESIEWMNLGAYQRAIFVFNGIRVEAFFDQDGEMVGFDRYVTIIQLPLDVLRAFAKHFPDATIVDILEIKNSTGTSYRLNVDVKNKFYSVKISSGGTTLTVIKQQSNLAKDGS